MIGQWTERLEIMKEKSAWERFFDDTEDIQCISCLDANGRKRTSTIRH